MNKDKFKCEKCEKVFCKKQSLDYHTENVACDAKYVCDKCGKEFAHQSRLYQHKARKTPCEIVVDAVPDQIGEKQCKFCLRIFYSKYTVSRHQESCGAKNTDRGLEAMVKKLEEKHAAERKTHEDTVRILMEQNKAIIETNNAIMEKLERIESGTVPVINNVVTNITQNILVMGLNDITNTPHYAPKNIVETVKRDGLCAPNTLVYDAMDSKKNNYSIPIRVKSVKQKTYTFTEDGQAWKVAGDITDILSAIRMRSYDKVIAVTRKFITEGREKKPDNTHKILFDSLEDKIEAAENNRQNPESLNEYVQQIKEIILRN